MEYVRLGDSGLKVSRLCIGCMSFGGMSSGYFAWTLDYEAARPIIDRAIDLGINFFDTADMYSEGRSEQVLGRAVAGRRDDLVIATKVYNPMGPGPNDRGLSRKHIRREVKRSLERLGMDYIDLYQIHRWDYDAPIEETLRTLDGLVRDGSVNYIGASSMWAWQFAEALDLSKALGLERFVSMQDHYNLAYREEEREMIPLCRSRGVGLIPWSPLARGFLTGKYRRDEAPAGKRYESDVLLKQRFFKPQDFDVLDALEAVAKEKGATPAQVALAWLLHKPGVASPIVGISKVEQLEELVSALEIKLSADEVGRLEAPYHPRKIEGHF
ncbi:MAG: aldo/keto reductase [Nitrososphaerales archaeon]|jgi:aryl-alcohol dehydrogenase-like predicted oxidoreductase